MRLAAYLILKRLKFTPDSPLDFVRLFMQPEDWLLVMPAEATAFDMALLFCRELQEHLREIRLHLLVPEEFRHWVATTPKLKVHPYHQRDLFLGRFPRKDFLQRLRSIHPAIAVDLSPQPTPLSLWVCGFSGARLRGAISRPYGDDVFNFLVVSRAEELREKYRTFFAYLH